MNDVFLSGVGFIGGNLNLFTQIGINVLEASASSMDIDDCLFCLAYSFSFSLHSLLGYFLFALVLIKR